jgi:hypothetical protein
MKHIRILLMAAFVLVFVNALPMFAQDAGPVIDYAYNGFELQRFEDGVVVQSWTMPNGLETQQLVAALKARAQSDDPDVRYVFDNDRMYHLRGNDVIALWLLRGGQWIVEPDLVVQYEYTGREIQRFVNGEIQQAWTLTATRETAELLTAMQERADQLATSDEVVAR